VPRASGSSCVLSVLDDEGLLAGFEPEGGRLELQRPPRCSSTALIRIQVSLSRRCALSLQLPHTATRIVRSLAPAESIAETLVTAGFKPQHSHIQWFGSDKRANMCALAFLRLRKQTYRVSTLVVLRFASFVAFRGIVSKSLDYRSLFGSYLVGAGKRHRSARSANDSGIVRPSRATENDLKAARPDNWARPVFSTGVTSSRWHSD
jgi:hypothetical protein